MKMRKKSVLLGLTALIVVAAMAIGGTLAYFTHSDSAENTFTIGEVEIDLFEHNVSPVVGAFGMQTWALGTTEVEENTYRGIYPGAELPKDPAIKNIGTSAAYVQMKLTISNASAWTTALGTGTDLSAYVTGFDSLKWRRSAIIPDLANDTLTYVYEYRSILAAGSSTGPIFTKITIPSDFDNADMLAVVGDEHEFTLDITAEAIQAEGFANATAAFAELNA